MAKISIKQKEAKTLVFTVTDQGTGAVVDCSGATLAFAVKATKSAADYLISKADGDLDKSQAAVGVVKVGLTSVDTDQAPGCYCGELEVGFSEGNRVKSADIEVVIERAVIA